MPLWFQTDGDLYTSPRTLNAHAINWDQAPSGGACRKGMQYPSECLRRGQFLAALGSWCPHVSTKMIKKAMVSGPMLLLKSLVDHCKTKTAEVPELLRASKYTGNLLTKFVRNSIKIHIFEFF